MRRSKIFSSVSSPLSSSSVRPECYSLLDSMSYSVVGSKNREMFARFSKISPKSMEQYIRYIGTSFPFNVDDIDYVCSTVS